jgi:hypothetical protein
MTNLEIALSPDALTNCSGMTAVNYTNSRDYKTSASRQGADSLDMGAEAAPLPPDFDIQ